jgi:hypothetical protein
MCRNNCHGDALSEEKKGFWEEVSDWYQEAEPPQGFQGDLWLLRYLSAFSNLFSSAYQWQSLAVQHSSPGHFLLRSSLAWLSTYRYGLNIYMRLCFKLIGFFFLIFYED